MQYLCLCSVASELFVIRKEGHVADVHFTNFTSLNFSRFVAVQKLNRKLRISDPILHRTRDQRRNLAMAIVSHLHHLFNLETCQSYIHTLRWKDRPPPVSPLSEP